jgi:hypothetical protein
MKITNLLAAAMIALQNVQAEMLFDLSKELTKTFTTAKAGSGAIVETTSWHEHSERNIKFPQMRFVDDWAQQADFMTRMTEHLRDRKTKAASNEAVDEPLYDCIDRMGAMKAGDDWTFLPVFVAELTDVSPTSSYNSSCFGTFNMEYATTSPTTFQVTVTLDNKQSLTCHETLLFANTEAWHMETFYGKGQHVLNFNMPTLVE